LSVVVEQAPAAMATGCPACIFVLCGRAQNCELMPQIGQVFLVFTMRTQGPFRQWQHGCPEACALPARAGNS
jgi:hypothetical protein